MRKRIWHVGKTAPSNLNYAVMFEFRSFSLYTKARSLHRELFNLAKSLKNENRFAKDQLSRASMSVVLNIAEGSSRFTDKERKYYFTVARGSVIECVAILDLLTDQEIINEEQQEKLIAQADEISRMLFSIIRKASQI
jgi:four helix bundle protein